MAALGRGGRRVLTPNEADVGEKGNVVDPGAVTAAGPSVIERTASVVSSTVTQATGTVRDKVIEAGAKGAVDEARDRLKDRREKKDGETDAADDGPALPPPTAT